MSTDRRDHPLELDTDTIRALVDTAMARIVDHLESIDRQPGYGPALEGIDRARRAVEPEPPTDGEPFESLLDWLFDEAIPWSFTTPGPGYLAYVPGGGIVQAALADLISDTTNRYVGVFAAAPVLAQVEANVLRWFASIVGYPDTARGFLASGGSLANFSALVTARRERLPENFLAGTIYTSDQVHHCVTKAAILAGFPERNVRRLPVDDAFRLDVDALREAVARDRADDAAPFCIVASAGTTNTGAVDDLHAIADVARDERLWLHVDAAYGGFFALTERGRHAMRGLERADSITLDPHKGLFLPYGTGALLVRDGDALRRAHALSAEYLPTMQTDDAFVDFNEISPELSRDFRGLRVWLPIKMHGIDAFRDALDEKLDLAVRAHDGLRAIDGIEIVAEPQLSTVVFRAVRDGLDGVATDRLNERLLDAIHARGRVHLTPTRVGGRFVIRICVLCFRTHADRIDDTLDAIRTALPTLS